MVNFGSNTILPYFGNNCKREKQKRIDKVFSQKMVKISKFAEKTTQPAKARQKATFFSSAVICRLHTYCRGNEKRIGKSAKISCHIFLSSVDL